MFVPQVACVAIANNNTTAVQPRLRLTSVKALPVSQALPISLRKVSNSPGPLSCSGSAAVSFVGSWLPLSCVDAPVAGLGSVAAVWSVLQQFSGGELTILCTCVRLAGPSSAAAVWSALQQFCLRLAASLVSLLGSWL